MTTKTDHGVIRTLYLEDIKNVVDLEKRAFRCPWTEEDFEKTIKSASVFGNACDVDGILVGYMIFEVYDAHVEIMNLAIESPYRRLGLATAMIQGLKDPMKINLKKRKKKGIDVRDKLKVFLDEGSLSAQLFYRDCGFLAVKVHRGYCDNGSDAYEMEYESQWDI